jgi:regulatory protein
MRKKRLTKEEALQKLRHFCRYQERCRSEIKNKLFELGINKDEYDGIISELVEENYLDEKRFAAAFAMGKFKLKHWGRKKIQYSLKEKSVDDRSIANALDQINDNDYAYVLKKLVEEKYASLKQEQYLVRKKKTIDYLMHKGYEADLVKTAVESMAN